MRLRYLVPFLALLISPACAADKTREVSLTTDQALAVVAVLSSGLDGYDKVVSDGGRERAVRELYKFSVGTRIAIARNIPALAAVTKPVEKVRQDRVSELSGGTGKLDPGTPAFTRFMAEWSAEMEKVHTFQLVPISEADLNLKDNPIPASVLSVILPILTE